jgi:hypothetical protein
MAFPVNRCRRIGAPGGRIPAMPARPSGLRFRIDGGLPCAAVAGVAIGSVAVMAADRPPLVFDHSRPILIRGALSFERPILEGFVRDIVAAPEIAGELVALYAEQHPALALRFVTRAVSRVPSVAAAILFAAKRRAAVHGLEAVALVLQAAVALAAPPPEEPELPPVILDLDCETLPFRD